MRKCEWALAIHGGAGILKKDMFSSTEIKNYEDTLKHALEEGKSALKNGLTAIDAVISSVKILEESPLFNAGRGSVIGNTGLIEMDASIMDGLTTKVGGVSCVKRVQHPILLAREVMKGSPHSLLVGDGAELFAQQHGLKLKPSEYFYTDKRWKQLQDARKKGQLVLDHEGQTQTVGAVAMDINGNLAAGTSTGGLTNKAYGRASDTSIIGAGNFAHNNSCAISGTGTGDHFIRNVTCYDFYALTLYSKKTLKEAADIVLEKLKNLGGHGGLVAIDKNGEIELNFNSGGMFRGKVSSVEEMSIGVF